MSTAVVGVPPEPLNMPSPAASRPLRLVSSNGKLSLGGRNDREEAALTQGFPAIRLTRRGRLFIFVMAAVAVAALTLVLATSVDAAAPLVDHVTTVSSGVTLSEIAATQLPSLPIQDAVVRIQLANGLNTFQVHAGQSLVIPAVP